MGRSAARMARLYVCAADHPCILGGGRFAPAQVETYRRRWRGRRRSRRRLTRRLQRHDRQRRPAAGRHACWPTTRPASSSRCAEIGALVKAAGGVLVLDAVQAAGRIPVDMTDGCADFLILSSHKIGGPKGAGAIVGAADLMMPKPLITGGGQEKGHRAGTENLAGDRRFRRGGARGGELRWARCEAVRGRRDAIEAAVLAAGARCRDFRPRRRALANTTFFAHSRHEGRDGADRLRSRRASRFRRARPARRARSGQAMC